MTPTCLILPDSLRLNSDLSSTLITLYITRVVAMSLSTARLEVRKDRHGASVTPTAPTPGAVGAIWHVA